MTFKNFDFNGFEIKFKIKFLQYVIYDFKNVNLQLRTDLSIIIIIIIIIILKNNFNHMIEKIAKPMIENPITVY